MEKYDVEEHGATQGALMTFLRCRQEAHYKFKEGLVYRLRKGVIDFGNMWHDVLCVLQRKAKKGTLPEKRKARYTVLKKVARKTLARYRKENIALAPDAQTFENQIGQVRLMIPYYLYAREGEGGKLYIDLDYKLRKWLAVEKVFDVNFRGFRLRGKWDGVYRDTMKELRLQETKTKGQVVDAEITNGLLVDFQVLLYLTAIQHHFKETPAGCDYNIIRRPQHKTIENFKAALRNEPAHFFGRYEVTFTLKELDEFADELEKILIDFRDWSLGALPTYKGRWSCIGWKWNCGYLPLCAEGRRDLFEVREHIFPELEED